MNRVLFATLLVGASASAFAADEMARVISATPVSQQVGVPRTACATYAAPGVAPLCSTQTIYENRTVAYNVIYEYAGKQYSVQLPQNPGPTLRLGVAGVQAVGAPVISSAPSAAVSPMGGQNVIDEDPAMTGQAAGFTQPYPQPVQVAYAYPGASYYSSPYYGSYGSYWGPVVSLGFVGGYYGGRRYYGGHGGHGHRR